MGMLADIFLTLLRPRRKITGCVNEYHLSEQKPGAQRTPLSQETLFARENFLRTAWDLYSVRNAPLAPFAAKDETKKIADSLTLREAFNRVRAHEKNPSSLYLKSVNLAGETSAPRSGGYLGSLGMKKDGKLFLWQVRPENDPCYWRNLLAKRPDLFAPDNP
jgi:hypothetical protein